MVMNAALAHKSLPLAKEIAWLETVSCMLLRKLAGKGRERDRDSGWGRGKKGRERG
jgi:hypothetical protein